MNQPLRRHVFCETCGECITCEPDHACEWCGGCRNECSCDREGEVQVSEGQVTAPFVRVRLDEDADRIRRDEEAEDVV
jgi:hypothetical protein